MTEEKHFVVYRDPSNVTSSGETYFDGSLERMTTFFAITIRTVPKHLLPRFPTRQGIRVARSVRRNPAAVNTSCWTSQRTRHCPDVPFSTIAWQRTSCYNIRFGAYRLNGFHARVYAWRSVLSSVKFTIRTGRGSCSLRSGTLILMERRDVVTVDIRVSACVVNHT